MEQYSNNEAAFSFVWFFIWVSVGFYSLYVHNLVLPYIFLATAIGTYASHMYLACTRCSYFGKTCYLAGGLVAPKFFKPRHQGPLDPDDSISATAWFILGVFPVPFLLYYQDWILLAAYSAITYGWYWHRKRAICKKCRNEWCPR